MRNISVCAAGTAGQEAAPADPFALDGARNIVEEEHFGIADGKATCGIPYRDVFSINGLWAPPYVSSDFGLGVRVLGQPIITEHYTWHPYSVERTGVNQAIAIHTVTMLVPGTRAGLLDITLKNLRAEPRTVPVAISVGGTLDRVAWWEFGRAASKTATTRKVADGSLMMTQGEQAIVLRGSNEIVWDNKAGGHASVTLPASGQATLHVVFAIGPSADGRRLAKIAADVEKAVAGSDGVYPTGARAISKAAAIEVEQSGPGSFLLSVARPLCAEPLGRSRVPAASELHDRQHQGRMRLQLSVGFREPWEILPLLDPDVARVHIKQFLATDMLTHFSFDPIGAVAWGPWYPVNQEKIVGLIYYYVKNTGDTAFLSDMVAGKTVWIMRWPTPATAMTRRSPSP